MPKNHYSKTELRGRGWTDSLIAEHLGDPDTTRVNMHRKSGPRVQLYAIERVHAAEVSPLFIAAQEGRAQRRVAARKAAETKRMKLEEFVRALHIDVPMLAWDELTRRAIDHFNDHRYGRGHRLAAEDSDEGFLDRIRVNYLRHQLTGYEASVEKVGGKVGSGEAYLAIKTKVLDAIADCYPDLAPESWRQQDQAERDFDLR